MNLYPDSKEWVLNELINPNTNQVTEKLDFLNKIIPSYNDNLFKDYSYVKLLEGFNKFLPIPNLDYERSESEDWYKEIKSIIQAGVVFFKGNLMFNLKASCYDVCAILLICKKLKEEKITYLEYPEIFIKNILVELNDSFLSDNDYLHYPYLVDFFSYNTVQDDEYMKKYYVLSHMDNAFYGEDNTSLSLFLNGGYYSYLFYNERFKSMTYHNISEEEITQLDDYIINNVDFKKELFSYNAEALSYRNEWITDRDTVILAVKDAGGALEFASEELRSDRKVVLEAVKKNGDALEFASEELRSDREIVLEAVKSSSYYECPLQFASEELRSDREVVLEAAKKNGYALQFASEELRSDREVVLEAVKKVGVALEYASESLRSDREVVLEAVKNDGSALEFASDDLKSDREIILEAVKNEGGAFQFAIDELKSDRLFVLAAVKNNGPALEFASEDLRSDREVVLAAVKNNGYAFQFASDNLNDDSYFIIKCILANHHVYDVIPYIEQENIIIKIIYWFKKTFS